MKIFSTLVASLASALGMNAVTLAAPSSHLPCSPSRQKSRGHGLGLSGNKHAKSSFKQNKRRGL